MTPPRTTRPPRPGCTGRRGRRYRPRGRRALAGRGPAPTRLALRRPTRPRHVARPGQGLEDRRLVGHQALGHRPGRAHPPDHEAPVLGGYDRTGGLGLREALAAGRSDSLGAARDLLPQKPRGQAGVRGGVPDGGAAVKVIRLALEELERVKTTLQLRSAEAKAANAYWGGWASAPVPWARKDTERVPEHWRTVGTRSSPLTGSPRSAANPANAILNCLYAILEAEARIALLAVGLDPGLGVLHADLKARDSLALDLKEAVRPKADAHVLGLLRTHAFAASDFFETRQGICRVLPPLSQQLAETAPAWAESVAPVAEDVARTLFRPEGRGARRDRAMPTRLTGANRSAGREATRRRPGQGVAAVAADLPPACKDCGRVLDDPERAYCGGCLPERRGASLTIIASAGPEALARLRAEGRDPAHGGEGGQQRGRRNADHVRANGEWEQTNSGRET